MPLPDGPKRGGDQEKVTDFWRFMRLNLPVGSDLSESASHFFKIFLSYFKTGVTDRKIVCKFDDYVIADDVIGHAVIGHPEVRTDNFRLGLSGIENHLVVHGPQEK